MGAGKTIRVIIKEPNRLAEIKEIESGLKPLQNLVGGYIECVSMPDMDDADMILNETGKLDGLTPNFWIPEYKDLAVGTIVICGVDRDEGEHISLNNDQVESVLAYVDENDFFGKNSARLYREVLEKEPDMDIEVPELEKSGSEMGD